MVTCRQCGAVHRDDNVQQCADCGSPYFRTTDLWDQALADLGRRIGTDAQQGSFPLRALAFSAIRTMLVIAAALAVMVFGAWWLS